MDRIQTETFEEADKRLSQYNLHIPLKSKELDGLHKNDQDATTRLSIKEPNHSENFGSFHNIKRFASNRSYCRYLMLLLLNVAVTIYFIFATLHWMKTDERKCNFQWCNGYGMLIIIITLSYAGILYSSVFKRYCGSHISNYLCRTYNITEKYRKKMNICCTFQTILVTCAFLAILLFIVFDTLHSTERLIGLLGLMVMTLIMWIFSKNRSRVNWRPVVTGFILQFVFGLFIIRWPVGKEVLGCISDKVATFLNFASVGNSFVYSPELVQKGIFAFAAIPVIFFMSFMVSILYYLGVMQWAIMKMGWLLQNVMDTTVCESMNASANIFLGMTETPLLINPYLSRLTKSEIHAVMSCGFATVSGTVMAAYISFGAEPSHLISASLMSAPAALCFSKLFYPEVEETVTSYKTIELEKSKDKSLLDAATKGALAGIPLILGIISNIIAFVSFIAFLNAILSWLGALVGHSEFTLELVMSKVFMPLAWLMGIPWDQCEDVGTLIGLKTVVNEFIAFQKLGEYKLTKRLTPRSQAIATYAICGFSNPGSIGILMGALTTMVPERTADISSVAIRAFIVGSIVCFSTACVAGILMTDDFYSLDGSGNIINSTILNTANMYKVE